MSFFDAKDKSELMIMFFQVSTLRTEPSQCFPIRRNPLIYIFSTPSDSIIFSSSAGNPSNTKSSLGGSSNISETMI